MSRERRHPVEAAADFGRVAVLMGGRSAEREISLMTGKAVLKALRRRGVDAHAMDPGPDIIERLRTERFDRAWIALHGRGGEDGTIQGAMQAAGMRFTGSGVLGSALGMDKLRSKQLFLAAGLATPTFELVGQSADGPRLIEQLGLPLILKPAGEGSSVGMSKVDAPDQFEAAWQLARQHDACVLAETWVDGAEYSVPVLQGEALPIIRIETPHVFYDYDAKYFSDETQYFCPSGLDADTEQACRLAALAAFDAVGASGWGRVDFLMGEDAVPHFLEVNTIPGMTSHSLVPMGAREAGIDFDELVWRILETSMGAQDAGVADDA
ncbi:MAG: D-alanine--D-alanine ligase [Gammaproteobacteria bacterium]